MIKYLEIEFNKEDIDKLAENDSFAELIQWALNNFLWGKSIKVKEIKQTANVRPISIHSATIADSTIGIIRGIYAK